MLSLFDSAYRGKTVFVTGHTGFKGSWLCLWLEQLGAQVVGYALAPPTQPSLFEQAGIAQRIEHHIGDVCDAAELAAALVAARPDFIFHLAAQPLVVESYAAPAQTFATNLFGTIHLLEAIRGSGISASTIMVTTDKVYCNDDSGAVFAESDSLGGHDPYSASKAAMEIAVASWRASFFASGPNIATARAGNVIGGGDWSSNRLVPDLVRAVAAGHQPRLRNPHALRPWQHVLEPLAGYLWLGAKLAAADGAQYAQAWNFGPNPADTRSVGDLANTFLTDWGRPGWSEAGDSAAPHEASQLRLSIDKAVTRLGWRPVWDFATTVARTADWYRVTLADPAAVRATCLADLDAFCADAALHGLPFAR